MSEKETWTESSIKFCIDLIEREARGLSMEPEDYFRRMVELKKQAEELKNGRLSLHDE